MANWGMKISRTGINVNTGDDKDMVFTSKYSNLKGVISGIGSKVLNSGDRTQKGTGNELSISHGLNYIPFAQVWVKFNNSWFLLNNKFYPLSLPYISTAVAAEAYYHYCDSSKLYLDFYWEDLATGTGSNTVTYKYFIFLDKGKL